MSAIELDPELERGHVYAYLTTTGRVSSRPHRIEIWYAIVDGAVWVNSGGGHHSDWVKNLAVDPSLVVEIGDQRWNATATILDDLGAHPARERLAGRYQGWTPGDRLSEWATSSLLIRIDITNEA